MSWFARVDFYAVTAAAEAIRTCHRKLEVSGLPIPVLPSKRTNKTDLPLGLWRCKEVANHYFGHDGWSSQVSHLKFSSQPTQHKYSFRFYLWRNKKEKRSGMQ